MLAVTFSVAWKISLRLFARELGFNFPLCAGARLVTYSPNFDARKTEKILGCTSSSLQVLTRSRTRRRRRSDEKRKRIGADPVFGRGAARTIVRGSSTNRQMKTLKA